MKKNIFAITFIFLFVLVYFGLVILAMNIAYPVKYLEDIKFATNKFNVSNALVLSVINAESSFNKNAVSSAGAIGLMQLLPSTAEFVAQKVGYKQQIDLFNARCNIYLGVAYISYLQNCFSSFDRVICAYNAGEGVVREWKDDEDGYLIIEYQETKKYLQKVKKNLGFYSKKVC